MSILKPWTTTDWNSNLNSWVEVIEYWEKNSKWPLFKREICTETLRWFSVLPMHWDIIKVIFWKTEVHWIVTLRGNKTIVVLDGEVERIDEVKVLSNIYKCFSRFHDRPESFDDFLGRFTQRNEENLEENNSTIDEYNKIEWYTHKWENHDFFQNPNIGWKLHISVSAEEIEEVWEYLKEKWYYFKLLDWGDWNEKTFTIYTWSFKKTKEIWEELWQILRLLKIPKWPWVEREISFWIWIVWRFCVATDYDSSNFLRYWIVWMDMIRPKNRKDNYLSKLNKWEIEISDEQLLEQARSSFNILSSIFWAYFHW